MRILAIETSCDETSAAVVEGDGDHVRILTNVVGRQIATHKRYGGVVPELAARRHAEMIIPVVKEALEHAKVSGRHVEADALAVTYGPGLMVALTVGVETAKALSYAWGLPIIGVNHIEGHIYSVLADGIVSYGERAKAELEAHFFDAPSIALIVSGGHTELVNIRRYGSYEYIGRTRDDAAGEAFDKVAKILGLPYPGGPEISKFAARGRRDSYDIPRPMLNTDDFQFSFAGLKTHVLYRVQKLKKEHGEEGFQALMPDIAASVEEAICEVLVAKTVRAALSYDISSVVVTGGVSANSRLRAMFAEAVERYDFAVYFPPLSLTGDNAGMIGIAGYLKARYTGGYDDVFELSADPALKLSAVSHQI